MFLEWDQTTVCVGVFVYIHIHAHKHAHFPPYRLYVYILLMNVLYPSGSILSTVLGPNRTLILLCYAIQIAKGTMEPWNCKIPQGYFNIIFECLI